MLHQDKAKLDAATPNPLPSTLVARDALEGSTLHVLALEVALTFTPKGTFNVAQAQAAAGVGGQASIRAQQGAAGQSGGALLLGGGDAGTPGQANTWAGNTFIQLGQPDAATGTTAALELLAGGGNGFLSVLCKGGAAVLTATTAMTLAAGAATVAISAAGLTLGVPLVQVANAPAAPTTNPPSGLYLYAESGTWKARSAAGVVTTLAPAGTSGPALQRLDVVTASLKTTTNVGQVLLAYAVPLNTLVELDASIQAQNATNGWGSWFRRVIRVKRGTGAPVLKPVVTPAPDDDETGGLVVTVAINGSNLELRVGGVAGVTLAWFVAARVQVFGP